MDKWTWEWSFQKDHLSKATVDPRALEVTREGMHVMVEQSDWWLNMVETLDHAIWCYTHLHEREQFRKINMDMESKKNGSVFCGSIMFKLNRFEEAT